MPTVGSLFAGIGGIDLGLERAGWTVRWQIENDPFCQRVLSTHWPDVDRFSSVEGFLAMLDDPECCKAMRVDLLCGGDPCQENSAARQGVDTVHPSLAPEFLAIVARLRPRCVLRENPTATRHDAPWPWWRFRAELERLGYAVLPFRLRACCLGAHHRRDRLFVLAELADSTGQPGVSAQNWDLERSVLHQAAWRPQPDSARRRPGWVPEPPMARVAYGIPERLARHRACGNAVVPQVAEWIGRHLLAVIEA